MVQFLLTTGSLRAYSWLRVCFVVFLLAASSGALGIHKEKPVASPIPPDLLLEAGRKLTFERSFQNEKDVRNKPGFFGKVLNIVAGEPDYKRMVRPYSIAVDSRGRAIITDPGARGVHIFDFVQHKYKFISRPDQEKNPMRAPQCVALDSGDNIYVTDSESGKIFVFEPSGKLRRVVGSLKGGEGFFKRPTGIAVDSAAQRIYITDTLRDMVFVLDMNGAVLKSIGNRGDNDAEFNLPTEVLVKRQQLFVVDAMNFRVQTFNQEGEFQGSLGKLGDTSGRFFRPKGIALDSEGHLYVVDGLLHMVQVFNAEGQLLYYFGKRGGGLGEFQLPAGLFIDQDDRVFVVDSYNHRVQVFRYYGQPKQASGRAK
jgi:DNA-binding beta-propeller fold protein YncE